MIRQAGPSDLDAIRGCATAAYAGYVERIGTEPAPMVADFAAQIESGFVFVAVDAVTGAINGYIVFYPRSDHVHLESVAVLPARQGSGIGRELIGFAEHEARRLGFGRIELYTNAKMHENLDLYPRLGYRRFDRRIEDGFDRVYFRKPLN